jgi:hypothetical protein
MAATTAAMVAVRPFRGYAGGALAACHVVAGGVGVLAGQLVAACEIGAAAPGESGQPGAGTATSCPAVIGQPPAACAGTAPS